MQGRQGPQVTSGATMQTKDATLSGPGHAAFALNAHNLNNRNRQRLLHHWMNRLKWCSKEEEEEEEEEEEDLSEMNVLQELDAASAHPTGLYHFHVEKNADANIVWMKHC